MKQQNKITILLLFAFFALEQISAQNKLYSLEEIRSLALENNKKLQKAQKELEAAQAALASAKAGGKPTVDASVTGVYLTDPLTILFPELQVGSVLSASQVLYAGGRVQNAKKITQSAVNLQTAQKSLTEDEVLFNTESAYWQTISVKEKLALATEYVRLLEALRVQLKNAFDAGLTYKNDLLKVEVQLNEAELNLTKAEDGLTMSKLNLAQITGLDNLDFDIKIETSIEEVLLSEADKSAIENRPEVEMLTKAVEIQELQTKLLQGDRRPTVALSANGVAAFGKQINFEDGSNDMQFFVGLVSLNIPILDWGGRKQKVKEQQFKTEAQKLELEETKELLTLEAKSAWLQLNQSVKRIQLTQKSLQQAEENLRLNQDRFDVGTVLGEDVLEAQVLWQQAYSNVIDAKSEFKINEARYKKATGNY